MALKFRGWREVSTRLVHFRCAVQGLLWCFVWSVAHSDKIGQTARVFETLLFQWSDKYSCSTLAGAAHCNLFGLTARVVFQNNYLTVRAGRV